MLSIIIKNIINEHFVFTRFHLFSGKSDNEATEHTRGEIYQVIGKGRFLRRKSSARVINYFYFYLITNHNRSYAMFLYILSSLINLL